MKKRSNHYYKLLSLVIASPLIGSQLVIAQDFVSNSAIDEIVVTARKRVESAQEIPISITVASGEELKNRSVVNFVDLQSFAPALGVVPAALSSGSLNVAMRGNVLPDIRLNVEPSVGVYLDGVYLPRNQGMNNADLYDIERVEVLAGPQSTLYGKNTTGGAVNIISKLPEDTFEGSLRIRYAEHDERQLAGMINVPVTDGFALRVVTSQTGRDGYGRNQFDGKDVGELNSQYWRASALWKPADDLSIVFSGDYSQTKSKSPVWKGLSDINFNGLAVTNTMSRLGITRQEAFDYLDSFQRGNKDSGSMDQPFQEDFESWGYSMTIEWNLSDSMTLKSITAMRGFEREGTGDLDGTPMPIIQYPLMETDDDQFSQEIQLTGTSFTEQLNWVIGGFLSREKGNERIDQVTLGGAPSVQIAEDIKTDGEAIYAQGTWHFSDKLSTTAGVRYNKDKRSLKHSNYNATTCLSLGMPLSSVPIADCQSKNGESFDEVTYTLGLEYAPWDARDILLYAKTSRGYRSGGVQQNSGGTSPAVAAVANQPYDPEILQDIEIGIKSTWMERRLLANISFFMSELDDMITTSQRPIPGTTAVATSVLNAATANIDGIEWQVIALPAPQFELGFSGTYLDASYDKFITPTGQDRTDEDLRFVPELRYAVTAIFKNESSYGQWRSQLDWWWQDKMLTGSAGGYSEAEGILNGRISLFLNKKDVEVALYGKNLADNRYWVFPNGIGSLGFTYNGFANPPRTIGVEINVNF